MLYFNRNIFVNKREKFIAWLIERGASMMPATNEWELLRWKGSDLTHVVYTNAKGRLSYSGDAEAALAAFNSNASYRVTPATPRKGRKVSQTLTALRKRDGDACFYCLGHVSDDTHSVEHLVSVTHGGPNHMSNYVLAHKHCNAKAGHASAMEKFQIHLAARAAMATGQPATTQE